MKLSIFVSLVASTLAMDTVPITSLIKLNSDPPVSCTRPFSGLPQNNKIGSSWTDNKQDKDCLTV